MVFYHSKGHVEENAGLAEPVSPSHLGVLFPLVGSQVATFDKWDNDPSLFLPPKASGRLTFITSLLVQPFLQGSGQIPAPPASPLMNS